MRLKTILIAVVLVAGSFVAALKVMDYVSPRSAGPAPVLVQLPPLPAQFPEPTLTVHLNFPYER